MTGPRDWHRAHTKHACSVSKTLQWVPTVPGPSHSLEEGPPKAVHAPHPDTPDLTSDPHPHRIPSSHLGPLSEPPSADTHFRRHLRG